jgi:hypothetical protein
MPRGTRFSCTPYYPDAPQPVAPVPPVTTSSASPDTPLELVKRFDKPGSAPIWQSIQYMDHEGMALLRRPAARGAVNEWERYLARTKVSCKIAEWRPS